MTLLADFRFAGSRPGRVRRYVGALALAVAVAAAAALPYDAAAQAFCSAPHSAPLVGASGSILLLEPGAGWIHVAARGQRSTHFYGTDGAVHDIPGMSRATTLSAYVSGAIGIVRGLELWAQVPLHRLQVDDDVLSRTRTGLGDPRVSVRVGSELFGLPAFPVSVRGGMKAAGSEFPVDPRVLPLSEGQTDWEMALEAGVPAGERLYVIAWAGYRWRTVDDASGRKPGDEWFGHLAVGGDIGGARLELGMEALDGRTPVINGIAVPASARRLIQIAPSIGVPAGRGRIQLGAQVPVSGRSLPTGPAISLGYLLAWSGR